MSERRERLLAIITLLADGQRWACTRLAYKFSVSRQTINKNIMELSIYYPIVTYMGKSGGVECLSVPKTITTLLNREDGKILIVDSIRNLPHVCTFAYLWYYNNERISLKLKGMSPVQYRTHSQI